MLIIFQHNTKNHDDLTQREPPNSCRTAPYMCSDDLPVPHFISWSPIHTPEPSFHQPIFFGEITLG